MRIGEMLELLQDFKSLGVMIEKAKEDGEWSLEEINAFVDAVQEIGKDVDDIIDIF